eukprot:6015380-Amphidinium_carterae.1
MIEVVTAVFDYFGSSFVVLWVSTVPSQTRAHWLTFKCPTLDLQLQHAISMLAEMYAVGVEKDSGGRAGWVEAGQFEDANIAYGYLTPVAQSQLAFIDRVA